MREKSNQVSSFIGLLVSSGFCILSYQLGLGNLHQPGPGFFPFLAGCILGLLSILQLIKEWINASANISPQNMRSERIKIRNFLELILATFLYGALLERVGFLLTTMGLIFVTRYSFGVKDWKRNIFIGFLTALIVYLGLEKFLKIRLPRGLISFF